MINKSYQFEDWFRSQISTLRDNFCADDLIRTIALMGWMAGRDSAFLEAKNAKKSCMIKTKRYGKRSINSKD
jgi:hypothetical protein